MHIIAFIDTEIEPQSGKILDIGSIRSDGGIFHTSSVTGFVRFIRDAGYLCGHNIIHHDLKYLRKASPENSIAKVKAIDTLYWSPLLFPLKPYHALLKDDKLQSEDINNPLNDAKKARDLFYDEVTAFHRLDDTLKRIYYDLLGNQAEFRYFFEYVNYRADAVETENLIRVRFGADICSESNIDLLIRQHPVELAYSLALICTRDRFSITPPWVLKNYPETGNIIHLLRNQPCLRGCDYCNKALDIHSALQRHFGFEKFRSFGGQPLQEMAVKAAVAGKSLLAVFPTGGGKSVTFQLPALLSGENEKGLTVVISPLQSLMKDQVDNLEKAGITEAVTINGLLDPIERARSIERVEDGSASLLYISPESLRSHTIERLLTGRKIVRFVIDEAHCFSSWGQDFRVDYLYIGDFIKSLQVRKNLPDTIPVSCFTATAKRKVIEDIVQYFRDKLSLDMEVFTSEASRSNLHYRVFAKNSDEDKYLAVRDLLEERTCPAIIYVSRTRKADDIAARLNADGFHALPFHGKMSVTDKTANQNAFILGEVPVMVATSAFGMGVDKKDVGMVIHYEISDSIENYIQEAGRAGRDEKLEAECFILFNEEDLNKHFMLLNQTRLSVKEIQQVWRAIQKLTRDRSKASESALEIARKAGWDDSIRETENRVASAIAALEEAGYLRRGQNMPRVFANSIQVKNVQEAIDRINASDKFNEPEKTGGIRIIKKLISSRSRKQASEEAPESRIDHIADHLGMTKEEVIRIINLLKEEQILADTKDLTAYLKKGEKRSTSLHILETHAKIENYLLTILDNQVKGYNIKEINEKAEASGCEQVTLSKIITLLNFWSIKHWIRKETQWNSKNHVAAGLLYSKESLRDKLVKRLELSRFILEYLYTDCAVNPVGKQEDPGNILVEFSVHDLRNRFEKVLRTYSVKTTLDEVEEALYYLSKIEAIKIEGGFLVVHNSLSIERLEKNRKVRYKADDYRKLEQFYENRIQQIHIVGEYAKKMISDYRDALQFVDDYFKLNYSSFLNKYFKGSRQPEINRSMTPARFRQLFGELSPKQLAIINDRKSKYIVVAAGPGSGKTRILVHKLASLRMMEDVKHEQLLMLTFSRAAAVEFKIRLLKLIGAAANYIEIKTFHSYCFDLLGKMGSLEKSDQIIKMAVERIKNGEVEPGRLTKTVLVIDEAQDINAAEFELITTLIQVNEEMRVIAVGDDDQTIFEFRGASSQYLEEFISQFQATVYELVENYRSKSNLVEFANHFVRRITKRIKTEPVTARQSDAGKIKIVKYHSKHHIIPLVNDVMSASLAGSVCILAKTNEEALQIAGLLIKNGAQARLIQSNDGFNLYNVIEIRYLFNLVKSDDKAIVIQEDDWQEAIKELKNRYSGSTRLDICLNLARDFETINPGKKYLSDLQSYIMESRLEDFYGINSDTIYVSTMHKAKGREFDNVYLMLENIFPGSDEACRLLYVAMTRARQNLTIHYNGSWLNNLDIPGLTYTEDHQTWQEPEELIIQLTLKDVWLDYFIDRQRQVNQLVTGDLLKIRGNELLDGEGLSLVRYSGSFSQQLEKYRKLGYEMHSAKVSFILYWQKEGTKKEIKMVLPELVLKKSAARLPSNGTENG